MNKGEWLMAKKNKINYDDSLQYGRQTPNGEIEWHNHSVADKLGWTTVDGRLQAQREYDADIASLGLKLSDQNLLAFYTRRRIFSEAQFINDNYLDAPVTAEQLLGAGVTVGEVVDVSAAAEPGDPTHLIVDQDGLLVGAVTPGEPAVVTGGQVIIDAPANEEPVAEQTQLNLPANPTALPF